MIFLVVFSQLIIWFPFSFIPSMMVYAEFIFKKFTMADDYVVIKFSFILSWKTIINFAWQDFFSYSF